MQRPAMWMPIKNYKFLVKCQSKRNFARVNAIDTAILKKKIKIWLYFYAVFMLK